ncbi:phosphonate transport system permease protein [Rhizobium rosettiformans]|uniref:Phosphonate ABC transporter, permease protein PhnE n=2 Tax=Rhizobium rosettiformans TaxID=1368430 RepID=A0A4S8QAE6_9HYPH|nr:phosphonate ABC transporter, permease protein PhnE [Rhizobium rosettiformans]MBB5275595.1 phosphonate transport system permease protein [Rhizobium rosettiformans]THV37344.1 phosphonate ABC transporter, permease protein PhnE [Rhizobium rosettiformans W3]
MSMINSAELNRLAERYPHVLERSLWQRYRIPFSIGMLSLYFLFCWWFFAIGKTLSEANWGIASNYLADWVSYEIRPEFDIDRDGALTISYPRFDPIGPNPNPDWIETTRTTITRSEAPTPSAAAPAPTAPKPSSSFSFMASPTPQASAPTTAAGSAAAAPAVTTEEVITEAQVALSGSARIDIAGDRVTLTRGSETVTLLLDPEDDTVMIEGARPDWVEQRLEGGRVIAFFGSAGWIDVSSDRVRVRKRFFGWENFVFDTNSPFFGLSSGEVWQQITSGERIDPKMSNLALAWNNILYNASWQHLDVWTKLLQTIVMAFMGTLLAMLVAFPLSFIAARNITRNRPVNQITKRFFDFVRSVDMLIWALFFTRAFGPGPLAGISAIFVTDTGTLGKLYAEALENIDDKQREGVKSVGAPSAAVQRFGVLPQVMPVFASQALYFWESNTRSATIIGAVGAGGIGLKLWEAMRTNSDWENVAYMVLLILIVVFLFDAISNSLRSRLIGKSRH